MKHKPMSSEITGAPICAGEASPLRVATGGNANWRFEARCRRSPARANRRRGGCLWSSNAKTMKEHLNQIEYVI